MFTAGEGQCRGEFGIGETDEQHRTAADQKCQDGAESARRGDPGAGQNHPAPANHGAKGKRDHLAPGEDSFKCRGFFHQASDS